MELIGPIRQRHVHFEDDEDYHIPPWPVSAERLAAIPGLDGELARNIARQRGLLPPAMATPGIHSIFQIPAHGCQISQLDRMGNAIPWNGAMGHAMGGVPGNHMFPGQGNMNMPGGMMGHMGPMGQQGMYPQIHGPGSGMPIGASL